MRVLVTGGHGFLGSHLARRLYRDGECHVLVVDIIPSPSIDGPTCHEFIEGNLCDLTVCRKVVQNVDTVYHFAATMGGMGTIHSENDFQIYTENHTMTLNLLQASVQAKVKRFFYASSACVYPITLQNDPSRDVSLKETDVWSQPFPTPQGLYGLEKLNSELLVQQFRDRLDIRIARFHNVFGPGGSWHDGREKAPAALLRKATALKLLGSSGPLELWGDGKQRRSFLWIGDAMEGVTSLMQSEYREPVNIGSEESICIEDLGRIALGYAGFEPDEVQLRVDVVKPVGVASRNSNNQLAKNVLRWIPQTPLRDAMRQTGDWITVEMSTMVQEMNSMTKKTVLEGFTESKVLDLSKSIVTFGILLPITSKGTDSPQLCIANLKRFTKSLTRTTWRDIHSIGGTQFSFKVYIAVDDDDQFLREDGPNQPSGILNREGILDVVTLVRDYPPGSVCRLWRDLAREACEAGCDYMVLMGDDVELLDEGWMRDVHQKFLDLASSQGVPFGLGCVAFTDISFPGMPTFPVIHRTHMEIFHSQVIPDTFVNQDGDPFLYQLYRRWGSSTMLPARITNSVGGETLARYTKQHAVDWTFATLQDAVSTVEKWVQERRPQLQQKLTLDIVIPCYRVDISILQRILALQPSDTCTTMFIVIIDDPSSPSILELHAKYSHRPDVRIRVNPKNLGASASRNRGMQESAAEWIHFLDDDIVPDSDLLVETEKAIRACPDAAGFVGTVLFPPADTVFKAAVHLAGVTYFWDIARKIDKDVPWGVTANIVANRMVKDGIIYDTRYPKTGGGEDIDFCRRKRAFALANGRQSWMAARGAIVTHPWWNQGARSYWRFYMWALGDGALILQHPKHTFVDAAPNAAELCLISSVLAVVALFFRSLEWFGLALKSIIAIIFANILHDCYRHLWLHPERDAPLNIDERIKKSWVLWALAVIEGSLIRMFSELGRLKGIMSRGEVSAIQRRFDWFCGRWSGPIAEERRNSLQRFLVFSVCFAMLCYSK